jgi:hypothetical protein
MLSLLLPFISGEVYSQKPKIQTDSLLIKNVYLISREDTLGDIKVNVLIINSTLQLVTRDDVSFGPADPGHSCHKPTWSAGERHRAGQRYPRKTAQKFVKQFIN